MEMVHRNTVPMQMEGKFGKIRMRGGGRKREADEIESNGEGETQFGEGGVLNLTNSLLGEVQLAT